MKISKIEHLGIAVKSIEEALPYYENVLGLKCYNIETVEDQKVRTAFFKDRGICRDILSSQICLSQQYNRQPKHHDRPYILLWSG